MAAATEALASQLGPDSQPETEGWGSQRWGSSAHDARAVAYAREIREWLVGRVGKPLKTGRIDPQAPTRLKYPRIMSWWMFEGRRYQGLEGSLATNWNLVDQRARRLFSSYNPKWRRVGAPEGETDWVATAFHSLTSPRPVYVSRASSTGLKEEEHQALVQWLGWIHRRWAAYVGAVGVPEGSQTQLPWRPLPEALQEEPDSRLLKRWAHTAKRSRWPLLRNVVAESLRCAIEPQELDQLPLPTDRAQLFELLCMVRILDAVTGTPEHVRWIDHRVNKNTVELPDVRYHYQYSLGQARVLATAEFDGGLREAVKGYDVAIPERADGWLEFRETRNEFRGILVEAKSGAQAPDATLHQLKCYRAALSDQPDSAGRLLVWGIVEEPWSKKQDCAGPAGTFDPPLSESPTDLWIFSTANEIHRIAHQVFASK